MPWQNSQLGTILSSMPSDLFSEASCWFSFQRARTFNVYLSPACLHWFLARCCFWRSQHLPVATFFAEIPCPDVLGFQVHVDCTGSCLSDVSCFNRPPSSKSGRLTWTVCRAWCFKWSSAALSTLFLAHAGTNEIRVFQVCEPRSVFQ